MDGTLLSQARAGDERALQQLYEESKGRVFRLALLLVHDAQSAEEVMQDALYYALTHIDRFDPARSRWTTWLHMITLDRSRNYLRRHRLLTLPLRLIGNLFAGEPAPDELADRYELDAQLHGAMLKLTGKQREAVALHVFGDYTFAEMGQILGCPEKTAQSRVRLGLDALRRTIESDPAWQGVRRKAS